MAARTRSLMLASPCALSMLLAASAGAQPAVTAPVSASAPPEADAPPGYSPVAGPERLKYRYDPKRGLPPGYEIEARPRFGFVIAGSLVFGITYMGSTIGAAAESGGPDSASASWLYLPLLGPFIGATQVDRKRMCQDGYDYMEQTVRESPCNEGLTNAFMLIGGLQLLGAAFVALGLTSPKKWVVPSPPIALRVLPMDLGRSGVGVGAQGHF